jgi:predicted metalloprotease with PDZ domain
MKRQIPVLHFFTGVHGDYHRPSDDSDKVDVDSLAKIVRLAASLVERMQSVDALTWNEEEPQTKGDPERKPMASNRGFSVWFGTVPSYGFEGPGLLLAGTSAGSPAEKAGMLAGDILLQVGEVRVETISDFMYALNIYKPGDVVEARFLRDGVEQSLRITLSTRDVQ